MESTEIAHNSLLRTRRGLLRSFLDFQVSHVFLPKIAFFKKNARKFRQFASRERVFRDHHYFSWFPTRLPGIKIANFQTWIPDNFLSNSRRQLMKPDLESLHLVMIFELEQNRRTILIPTHPLDHPNIKGFRVLKTRILVSVFESSSLVSNRYTY